MLQIKDIKKEYKTGELVQTALDSVSLSLRDSEFVAILGPSGSGKTTLLNIIGGLDRYDSGDLIINNVSTKQYKDRDWDSYRNHTIGFVFQSYNLIPHQSVLSNVELALTISGVSREEKRRRASEALEKVGLGDQLHKKPNQMSGGQMQRVAIARALVNDPDILLADEPTGALDTQTSIQILDLLKEVAKDRLVVMVTHNPELAEKYATRIVQLRDGKIIGDSHPYRPRTKKDAEPPAHKNMGKASMSFFTALALSFNNLWTKRARTILTAFAGSIGIIGIALILSLSNGVNDYIKNIEENTLSEYPISISTSGLDYSAAIAQMQKSRENSQEEGEQPDTTGRIRERHVVNTMFSGVSTNDLKSFKTWLDNKEEIKKNSVAVEYKYSVSPQIFRLDEKSGYRQVHPDQTMSSMGVSYGNFSSFAMFDMNIFFALPQERGLYENQYRVDAGHWPQNANECVLVLSNRGTITDIELYSLGLKDATELDAMIEKYNKGEKIELEGEGAEYTYDDFLGLEFSVVSAFDYYEYDENYKVYVDRTDNAEYMKKLVENDEKLTIVGVVSPLEDSNAAMLGYGVGFPAELLTKTIEQAAESDVVKAQLADKETDVFSGKAFGETQEKSDFDLSGIFSVDEKKMAGAFTFNQNALYIDPALIRQLISQIDLSQVDLSEFSGIDWQEMARQIQENGGPTTEQQELFRSIAGKVQDAIQGQIQGVANALTGQLAGRIRNAVRFNPKVFADAIKINLGPDELRELMSAMMVSQSATYEGNLRKLNYADMENPSAILIYPKDFESKNAIAEMIESYNNANREAGEDDKVITYTDYVATLMSSVTTIVNTISYVLIAFVAISLIVSSIMIGIITYISVLERTKEIGILRAIGASKRNVAQVFNAETFIIGLLAGILGVVVSLLLLIPGNALIHSLTGNPDVSAFLPLPAAVILIIISIVLTLIGGLIPSRKAAKKDPVTALRTE